MKVVGWGIVGLVLLLATLLFSHQTLFLFILYAALSVVLLVRGGRWQLYTIAVILALIIEPLAVRFGVWSYPNPDIVGVPAWIFLMWGIAALLVGELTHLFHKK